MRMINFNPFFELKLPSLVACLNTWVSARANFPWFLATAAILCVKGYIWRHRKSMYYMGFRSSEFPMIPSDGRHLVCHDGRHDVIGNLCIWQILYSQHNLQLMKCTWRAVSQSLILEGPTWWCRGSRLHLPLSCVVWVRFPTTDLNITGTRAASQSAPVLQTDI